MGSRTNYVIKNADQRIIYHHRWGGTYMASDLYLGEKSFLKFLKEECSIEIALREYLWMEALVIIDVEKKLLGFWAWEFEKETSVIRYYLSALQKIWPGWQLMHLANEMYDAAPLLGIDYYSGAQIMQFKQVEEADIINDPLTTDYPVVLLFIREQGHVFVVTTSDVLLESIICYGKDIIPLLIKRPVISIPPEGHELAAEQLVIDVDNKQIIIDASIFGIQETMGHKWPGYTFKMGRNGYVAMLEEANIPTAGLEMPQEAILERFRQITALREI